MKFIVKIDCDNAAFEEYPGEEVARILADVVANVLRSDPGDRTEERPFRLFDINGNVVGTAHFEEV
jgi:hypothetical protein